MDHLLSDVLDEVSEARSQKTAGRHYPTFNLEEWKEVEAAFGATVTPKRIKEFVLAIARGRLTVDKA
jgi:hypothetical protein